jgi:tetratricopeptide (TPR) repeat protein
MTAAVLAVLLGALATAYAQGHTDYSAWMTGAKIDYSSGRYEKAATKFHNAVLERPTSPDAREWLALSLSQVGKDSLPAAAAQFDTCFTLDSIIAGKIAIDQDKQYLATNALGAVAAERMAAGATIAPEDSVAAKAAYTAAVRLVKWAMLIDPKNPNYFMLLGNAYVELDMADSILAVAQRLLKTDSGSAQASYFMAIYFSKKNDLDSSLAYFEQAAQRYEKTEARAKEKLASILKPKNPGDVNPIVDTLVALHSNMDGLKKYIEEDLKQAKSLHEVAVVGNDLFIARVQIALSYFRAGQAAYTLSFSASDSTRQAHYFLQADTLLRQATTVDPENYDAFWFTGYVNYRMGRDTTSIEAFRRARKLSEANKDFIAAKDPELWIFVGTSEAKLKQYDSSVAHVRQALRANPADTLNYDILSSIFAEMSKLPNGSKYEDSAAAAYDPRDKHGWFATLWDVSYGEALGDIQAAKDMQFVLAEVTVFNKTDKPDSIDLGKAMSLSGDDKKSYTVDPRATAPDLLGTKVVDANKKLEATLVFSIPKSAKAATLVLTPFTGSSVNVSVQ